MRKVLTRSITGLIIIGVIVSLLLWQPYGLGLLVFLVASWGSYEILRMLKKDVPYIKIWRDTFFIALFPVLFFVILMGWLSPPFLLLSILIPSVYLIVLLYSNYTIPFNHFAIWASSLMYWVLPVSIWMIFDLVNFEYKTDLVLTVFITIWTADTMAYVTGSLIGKTKLFERVSPNKTWEGLFGAILFASIAGYLIGMYFGEHELYFALRGTGIAIVGAYGDLIESVLKRSMKVKDSGKILPGHGGVLDRFDAVVFCTPFVFASDYLYFMSY